ncbi:MAG TPA: hypothetical protein VE954_08820 [Oligoflexus sp.]|uniref:hypothetical protein n=1 Tax=Oligoflexus sp. TaxID=1971216 RepID=UPI002D33C36C|nr:hypothetical protein [Oligoflexus sp.]HYX33205.1 hypothetical protein [Oligoflexus sp.]
MTGKLEIYLLAGVENPIAQKFIQSAVEIMISPQYDPGFKPEALMLGLVVNALPMEIIWGQNGIFYRKPVRQADLDSPDEHLAVESVFRTKATKVGIVSVDLPDPRMPFAVRMNEGTWLQCIVSRDRHSRDVVESFGWITPLTNNPYATPIETWGLEAKGYLFAQQSVQS